MDSSDIISLIVKSNSSIIFTKKYILFKLLIWSENKLILTLNNIVDERFVFLLEFLFCLFSQKLCSLFPF